MRLGLLIAGATCAALAGCYVPKGTLWPPRDPVEHVWVPENACDVESPELVDCFEHVHFVAEDALVMHAPACADVTVRRWNDKMPNGTITIFYGRPAPYSVIGNADDKPVLITCVQHPLRYPLPQLWGSFDTMMQEKPNHVVYPNGYRDTLPNAHGVPVTESPDVDKVFSDKYVPEPH